MEKRINVQENYVTSKEAGPNYCLIVELIYTGT
jgi:hypothetical protein